MQGHRSIGRQFLDTGANVDALLKRDCGTALVAMARSGHNCIVRHLLDVGANVNIVSKEMVQHDVGAGGDKRAQGRTLYIEGPGGKSWV